MAEKKDHFKDFREGLREGYDEQDEKLRSDKRSNSEKVVDGFAKGAADEVTNLANPFSWIKDLLK